MIKCKKTAQIRCVLMAIAVLLPLATASAQVTLQSIQPRGVRIGAKTTLQLAGANFDNSLRVITDEANIKVAIEKVEGTTATLALDVPTETPPGALQIRVATDAGLSAPYAIMVDSLETIAENGSNSTVETAQVLTVPAAVSGTCTPSAPDVFRFHAAAGQRLTMAVHTQAMGSTLDPLLTLLDRHGKQIAQCDEGVTGPECQFSHLFSEEGDYFLVLSDSRYADGGAYHLRIGDFPRVSHPQPLAIRRGEPREIRWVGEQTESLRPQPVNVNPEDSRQQIVVPGFGPEGQPIVWGTVRVWDHPLVVEGEASSELPIAIPAGISGRLSASNEQDSYNLLGKQGLAIRIRSFTRSLGCATLLKMTLLNPAGAKVVETTVSDADEWSLDYTFTEDGNYQFIVQDLLDRGGNDFGYWVEIVPRSEFQLALKPDAATSDQFLIETQGGACALDLVIDRQGYEGVIDLALVPTIPGIAIVDPEIPAGAKEARIYLRAVEGWEGTSLAAVGLRGTARENTSVQSLVSAIPMLRVKQPEIPFPATRSASPIVLGKVAPTAAPWGIDTAQPVRLPRPLPTSTAKFPLVRKVEGFKGAVAFLNRLTSPPWQTSVTAEGDTLTTTFTRTGDSAAFPETVQLSGFSDFNGRGRIDEVTLPIAWFDPVTVKITGPVRIVAGTTITLGIEVIHEGGDPQDVTIRPLEVPPGIAPAEGITIAADQQRGEWTIQVAREYSAPELQLRYSATSRFQGTEFTVSGITAPIEVIPPPTSGEVFPPQVTLRGPKSRQQLVVTGVSQGGELSDWTEDAQITSARPDIVVVKGSVLWPVASGQTEVSVKLGDLVQVVSVTVEGMETPHRTAFENEVLVALSKQGCNSGACHGSPSGKGMFRLSLRAFDPKLDELTLIREDFGRRINRLAPQESLLLLKPLMGVAHGGGKHLHRDDEAYEVLRDWITEGGKADPAETPRCVKLEVYPSQKRILQLKKGRQQLSVTAHFADGSSRDVTHLISYESSNLSVAAVDAYGLVTGKERGESVILARYLEHIESIPFMFIDDVPDFQWPSPPAANYIDTLVHEKLQQLKYVPAELCSDEEFIRRATLDVIGLLPSLEETKAFLADPSPDKRGRWIDALLEREEYPKFWALKWGDLLRMTGKVIGDRGVYKYHRWVENAFATNMPYDQFARQLLTASGSTLANPPANFFRAAADMNDSVETISQVFLGARLQCAKCHNHPFERWTQDNYYGMGAFFHRVQRRNTQRPGEMFIWSSDSGEVTQPRTGQQSKPWLPVAGEIDVQAVKDRRQLFAQWLIDPANPYFARVEANRLWSQFFARGIVDPIDDFRDSNPPTNAPLLDALAKDFVEHQYDRKHLIRTIMNSRTYQASYQSSPLNEDDLLYFSHQQPRLLSAEQLLDAVNQTTGLAQPLGKLPAGTKATHLPAPDIVKVDFLKVFGQPERSTVCACERGDDSNLGMAIELLNGPTIHARLQDASNRFRAALAAGNSVEQVLQDLYLAALSRAPTTDELQAALAHCTGAEDVAGRVEDVCWAILNTDEFLFQH